MVVDSQVQEDSTLVQLGLLSVSVYGTGIALPPVACRCCSSTQAARSAVETMPFQDVVWCHTAVDTGSAPSSQRSTGRDLRAGTLRSSFKGITISTQLSRI